MEAQNLVDGLMQMDEDLSRVLRDVQSDIAKVKDSLPKLRSSWSQSQLEPPSMTATFEGSMAGSSLLSQFLEPTKAELSERTFMNRQSMSTRSDQRPLTSQPVNAELRAAENNLRVLAQRREAEADSR